MTEFVRVFSLYFNLSLVSYLAAHEFVIADDMENVGPIALKYRYSYVFQPCKGRTASFSPIDTVNVLLVKKKYEILL
jgi:hypothetical protein